MDFVKMKEIWEDIEKKKDYSKHIIKCRLDSIWKRIEEKLEAKRDGTV